MATSILVNMHQQELLCPVGPMRECLISIGHPSHVLQYNHTHNYINTTFAIVI
jgi:hypothetical protein